MDSVAANAQCTRKNNHNGVVRYGVRMRRCNTSSKSLRIPAQVPEDAEAKSALAVATPSPCPPVPKLPRPFKLDTDTRTAVRTKTSATRIGITNATELEAEPDMIKSPLVQKHCTDFSNYLGISVRAEADAASVTVVDSDSFTRVNSVEDTYGWEAELDRKVKCEVINAQSLCPYQYTQRAIASKHSLLQRIFFLHSNRGVNSRT